MKKVLAIALMAGLMACNSGNNDNDNDVSDSADRPRDPNEAVTNSTQIVNDSVIVPDTTNTGPNPSAGVDTVGPMKQRKQ
jgi:hypothetical protein